MAGCDVSDGRCWFEAGGGPPYADKVGEPIDGDDRKLGDCRSWRR